jgi:indolepyruvate ferredoxin oxidoreductase, beta subunit
MRTTRIMMVAVGGQGNILASRILGEAAAAAGITPRMSEFHGMAQRGGVVESMVLLGAGKGYCIADGTADILIGFEPAETIRAAKKCGCQTAVITNTEPLPPFTVAMRQASYPDVTAALNLITKRVNTLITINATSLAVRAGSALTVNMVMLGAMAASGANPVPPELLAQVIREKTKKQFVAMNEEAFRLGMEAASRKS